MTHKYNAGLGELLRHLLELVDNQAAGLYREQGFQYRPRYTPIMRVLSNGPCNINDITTKLSITQGAVSQSIKLMLGDGLIEKQAGEDARKTIIKLSSHGESLLTHLQVHWQATFNAIEALEKEIDFPLRNQLNQTISALQKTSFAVRIKQNQQITNKTENFDNSRDTKPNRRQEHFQSGAENYAKYRPSYPMELVDTLTGLSPNNKLAVDMGCGTGQLSLLLTDKFQQVIATDVSKEQIKNAVLHPKVSYRCESAEQTSIMPNSADLIVAAQAAHWFDLETFYREVKRIARPQAIIALISYSVPYLEGPANTPFQRFYWQKIAPFWPPERQFVENGYSDIKFPFKAIQAPQLSIQRDWDLACFTGYLRTWSASRNAIYAGHEEIFGQLEQELSHFWGIGGNTQRISWPINMRIGRL